jgi:hypothetical protein
MVKQIDQNFSSRIAGAKKEIATLQFYNENIF